MIVQDTQFDRTIEFDVAIGVCGYEPRSSHVCRVGTYAHAPLAIVYPGTTGPAFEANRSAYLANEWSLVREVDLVEAVTAAIRNFGPRPSILVDISSMARQTMALLVQLLWEQPTVGDVQFVYSPPLYESSVRAANLVPPLSAGPLTPYYAGALRSPSIPVGLVLGLGLEPHRASGLIELIEPTRLWAFAAVSDDERFIDELYRMHKGLLDEASNSTMLHYDIRSLAGVYNSLESLVFASAVDYRLMIAPSGPKLFTLAALLVGTPRTLARPAIWRVGSSVPAASLSFVVEAGDIVAASVNLQQESLALA